MGCACSNSRTAATLVYQYSLETSSPERLLYLAKKRAQVLKLFENLVAAPASRPGLDECILALSKGCQGFIATPSGGETSLIKRCIDQLLPLKVSNEKVVTAFLDFIHDAVRNLQAHNGDRIRAYPSWRRSSDGTTTGARNICSSRSAASPKMQCLNCSNRSRNTWSASSFASWASSATPQYERDDGKIMDRD